MEPSVNSRRPSAEDQFCGRGNPRQQAILWVELPQLESDRISELAVSALRDVYGVQHPIFRLPTSSPKCSAQLRHQSSLALRRGRGAGAGRPYADHATRPAAPERLVDAELAEMYGHRPIRDAEGDVAIRVGSTMLFLRTWGRSGGGDLRSRGARCRGSIASRRGAQRLERRGSVGEVSAHPRPSLRDHVGVVAPFVPAHLHQAVRILRRCRRHR